MNERDIFDYLLIACFALAALIFVALFFVNAPYGRHLRRGWGPTLNATSAWLLMETVAPVSFAVLFVLGGNPVTLTGWIFLLMWQAHYFHRAFIYPFRLPANPRRLPLTVVLMGLTFNAVNGYLNGRYLFTFSDGYSVGWLLDPRFIAGALIFVTGFVINRGADSTLRRLRQPGTSDYQVPQGGFYRWVSSPNYFGEILVWSGWALATWSLPGLAFALFTAANLAPRAWAHHRWYREHFPDYPSERKALVPRLW